MYRNKFSAILGATVLLVVVPLLLLGSASAQGHAGQLKVLYSFAGGNDGSGPNGGLTFDAAGNIYGTTQYGGTDNYGTVFKLSPNGDGSWTENVLYSLNWENLGIWPNAGVIFDKAGNLYSTNFWGGGGGNAFQLIPNPDGSWTGKVIYNFNNDKNGGASFGGLTIDSAGNLYGVGETGGNLSCGPFGIGCGVVFEIKPNSDGTWTESVIHEFNSYEGAYPAAALIFDAAGNLYGTTRGNPDLYVGFGSVFMLKPNPDGTWTESTLRPFKGTRDGGTPTASVTLDSSGNLYGTTSEYGTYGYGTAFKLESTSGQTWTEKMLHEFRGSKDGGKPLGGLTFDASGNLYGTTNQGGAYGYGTVFMLKPGPAGGWTEYVLHQFTGGNDGASPGYGDLTFDAAGNIYGTTGGGGTHGAGVVFEITSPTQ